MSRQYSQPRDQGDGETPRYLLPEGCSDLIDVLRREKTATTDDVRTTVSSSGGVADTVPNGMGALAGYLIQFFQFPLGTSSLAITTPRWGRPLFLVRRQMQVQLFCYFEPGLPTACDAAIQMFAAKHDLPAERDETAGQVGEHCLMYHLPAKLEAVYKLCRELLIEFLHVQPYEELTFITHELE